MTPRGADDLAQPRPVQTGPAPTRPVHAVPGQIGRAAAERLRHGGDSSGALDRLAGLAARLLGTQSSQVSLLTDVQTVAARSGLALAAIGADSPLADSLCTVTASSGRPLVVPDAATDARVSHLPPVSSGQVGAYLGVPLVSDDGTAVGAMCVFDPLPRAWSHEDVALLQQLASSAVAELELTALTSEHETARVLWELAIDAAGIGTFDWDLGPGRLSWDERLLELFGIGRDEFEGTIEAFNARVHADDLPRVERALREAIETGGTFQAEYRVVLPTGQLRGSTPAGGPCWVRTAPPYGCSVRRTTPRAGRSRRPASATCWSRCRRPSTPSTPSGGSPTSTPRPSGCWAGRARSCSAG